MPIYAVVSDIHANWQALQAVEQDASAMARERRQELHYIFLGDAVDYGPQPNQCVAWLERQPRLISIRGNHEQDICVPKVLDDEPRTINFEYWAITLWTRLTLIGEHKNWLCSLKDNASVRLGSRSVFLSHLGLSASTSAREHLNNLESNSVDFGLNGHTHHQGYYTRKFGSDDTVHYLTVPKNILPRTSIHEDRELGSQNIKSRVWDLLSLDGDGADWRPLPPAINTVMIFNPGSVGQPRQHSLLTGLGVSPDPGACYMLLQVNGRGKGEYLFRRVPYDVDETIWRIEQDVVWPPKDFGSDIYHSHYKEQGNGNVSPSRMRLVWQDMENLLEKVKELLIQTLRYGQGGRGSVG